MQTEHGSEPPKQRWVRRSAFEHCAQFELGDVGELGQGTDVQLPETR
jgi:hypothetical protein